MFSFCFPDSWFEQVWQKLPQELTWNLAFMLLLNLHHNRDVLGHKQRKQECKLIKEHRGIITGDTVPDRIAEIFHCGREPCVLSSRQRLAMNDPFVLKPLLPSQREFSYRTFLGVLFVLLRSGLIVIFFPCFLPFSLELGISWVFGKYLPCNGCSHK